MFLGFCLYMPYATVKLLKYVGTARSGIHLLWSKQLASKALGLLPPCSSPDELLLCLLAFNCK